MAEIQAFAVLGSSLIITERQGKRVLCRPTGSKSSDESMVRQSLSPRPFSSSHCYAIISKHLQGALRWFKQSVFIRHACFLSVVKRAITEGRRFKPLSQRFSFTINRNPSCSLFIVGLLLYSFPSAVSRFVMPVIINPSNRVITGWSRSNIEPEMRKGLVSKLNAPSTVAVISPICFISASSFSRPIGLSFRPSMTSSKASTMPLNPTGITPSPLLNRVCPYSSSASTFTATLPPCFAAFASQKLSHCQSLKFKPGKIHSPIKINTFVTHKNMEPEIKEVVNV